MSYRDRIQPLITLVSPDGTKFQAKWKGNKIKGSKRVGQFDYPNLDGTVVQDMGLKGFDWPLTLYFDGDETLVDHDTGAMAFLQALAQKGTDGRAIWTVTHPIYGVHYLQPIDFELDANPVESDGLTVVETTWIESIPKQNNASIQELAGDTGAQINVLNAAAAAQAAANIVQQTSDQIAALQAYGSQAMAAVKGFISTVDSVVNTINSGINSAFQGVTSVVAVVGQIQQLCMSPGLIAGNISSKISAFVKMVGAILTLSPTGITQNDKNGVAITEAIANAALSGVAFSAITATLTTKAQAVQAINDINKLFDTITNSLDAAQTRFLNNGIATQFFSQSKAYGMAQKLIQLVVAYLQQLTFDLKSVKTYTLTQGRSTLEIAMAEYGSRGWDDAYYDLFIASNNLHGNDIIWLPAGRKVTVFL